MTISADRSEAIIAHRARERKRWRYVLLFLLITAVSLVFDIATGPSMLSPSEVIRSLTGIGERAAMTDAIVREFRLQMALMALVVGAALGAGGAQMQTLLNNPMASPYTLGMAAAAGFGAALSLAFGGFGLHPMISVPIGAFIFSMIAALFLFMLASMRTVRTETIILGGIALLFLFQSLLSLIQFLSSPELSQQILFWLFGSLTKATGPTLALIFSWSPPAIPPGGWTMMCWHTSGPSAYKCFCTRNGPRWRRRVGRVLSPKRP